MGTWQHTHIITTKDVSPYLGQLAEIIDDENVQTMPLLFMVEDVDPFKLYSTSKSYI
jgi:hypothetical protein